MFADWTDRIAAGEVPPAPPRPQGHRAQRRHHSVGLGRSEGLPPRRGRPPTGAIRPSTRTGRSTAPLELSADYLPVLDPVKQHREPRRADGARSEHPPASPATMPAAVAVLGRRSDLEQQEQRAQPDVRREGPGLDHVGGAPAGEPGVLQGGVEPSVGEAVPDRHRRAGTSRSTIRRPRQLTHISTCFGTHHLMFAEDANHTLWTSGGGQVVGWLNTKMFDETGDEAKSQGWTALIMDTNGNGKRDAYVEPNAAGRSDQGQAIRRRVLRRVAGAGRIGLGLDPRVPRRGRSASIPGANPPETALAEVYEPPLNDPQARCRASRRAAWTSIATASSGRRWRAATWRSFDRRKCKGPLNGPKATGQHCPEGWTLYPEPLPQFKGVTDSRQRRSAATTPGSISSTRSGSGATRRSPPATPRKRCSR